MNGLDLFSGIGGITKALDGYVQPIAYCENDRYAQCVLLSRMAKAELPRAPIWDDIRTLRAGMLPGFTDVIYGGFPCQDISVAGRGAGLGGERSGLFSEIVRLTGEISPRFVFLENVPAIRTRGARIVVGEMARLGYDCRWGVLSAADVGANHRRERWWLLANAASKQARVCGQPRIDKSVVEIPDATGSGRRQEYQDSGRSSKGTDAAKERRGLADRSWWQTEPGVYRVAHGIPQRVDRLRALGNSVVPAQAREAFERLMGLKNETGRISNGQ
jgi:DNA (cytosine-5)-methyltransferase 1